MLSKHTDFVLAAKAGWMVNLPDNGQSLCFSLRCADLQG